MSRSRRHTPKIGITTARSEKEDKAKAHRRGRRASNVATRKAAATRSDLEVVNAEHPRSGRWIFAKDGKQWIGLRHPKELRK